MEKPSPKPNEVLVQVRATTVTPADWRIQEADPFLPRMMNGLIKPTKVQVLGVEMAGDVEAVGQDVTSFHVGDQVFASTFGSGYGAYAEFKCVPRTAWRR